MKHLLFSLFFLFLMISAHAQELDELINQTINNCEKITQSSSALFKKYIEENNPDSARIILNYWESKCGNKEPVFRARIILALLEGNYSDSLTDDTTLNHIFNYESRAEMIRYANSSNYDQYPSYYGYIGPGEEFDIFTRNKAIELKNRYNPESMAYLWSEFYGDNSDTLFSKIQSDTYAGTRLSKAYYKEVGEYLHLAEFHSAWIIGTWIPTGNLKPLGIHPDLGFMVGTKRHKMNYDFVMSFKFLKTPNAYYAYRPNSNVPELTHRFFGAYIGAEVGYDIYVHKKHELQLIGGIGYDGFDALEEDSIQNLESATANSFNFNAGIGYRYYIDYSTYIGLRAKYNFVDYSQGHTIDLTGNTLSLQLTIGGLSNTTRNSNLKSLKYKVRE